tara:strand:- start:64 stop:1158 length:1095 start_codon:yes stop_codon:yes gene_type:complete
VKAGCLIYYYGKYDRLGEVASRSFKKHHPDVTLHLVNEDNRDAYKATSKYDPNDGGIFKYALAHEIMSEKKYDKMIILGADTITCSRLDEFLDENKIDILTTLDYPYQGLYPFYSEGELYTVFTSLLYINGVEPSNMKFVDYTGDGADLLNRSDMTLFDFRHYNADVICINNVAVLRDIIDIAAKYKEDYVLGREHGVIKEEADYYHEQGGLNILCARSAHPSDNAYNYTIRAVEFPYAFSSVVYNVRARLNTVGVTGQETKNNDQVREFRVKDKKLYAPWRNEYLKTHESAIRSKFGNDFFDSFIAEKQVKLWHYGGGFSEMGDQEFENTVNDWIDNQFNDETKKFFKEECDTGDFFEKRYKI